MSDSNAPEIVTSEPSEMFQQTSTIESSGGLLIPEPRDGFYGYNDEKSLQQVSCRL